MSLRVEIIRGEDTETFETGGTVSLGRSDKSTVVLPGLAVARRHAEIAQEAEGKLRLRCKSPLGVEVNGRINREDRDLRAGDRFRIGAHQARLTKAPDAEGLLLRVDIGDPGSAAAYGPRRLDLRAAGLRLRRPAWVGAIAVLLLGLALPLLFRALNPPAVVEPFLPTDQLWNSGALSNAHQHFADDCGTCHEDLFQRVRDAACLECHEGIAHHSDRVRQVGLSELDTQRCASCHREHGSSHAVLPAHPGTCTDCHADPSRFPEAGELRAVHDFAEGHPAFRATVTRRGEGGMSTQRIALASEPRDETGLVFPHDVHLDAGGVEGPEGVEVMACADCHRPDAGRVGFRPIAFERDCQSCHALEVGIGEAMLRLPHADSQAVRRQVTDAARALPEEALAPQGGRGPRRRAGETADRGDAPSPEELVDEVFSKRVCAKCHTVDSDVDGAPSVQPVALRESWLVQARFTHADHNWVACSDCHAAEQSSDSADLLLPDIATCRSCHGGVASNSGVPSTCIACHRFHTASESIMGTHQGDMTDGDSSLDSD